MKERERTIAKIRDLLQRRASPRIHMLVLVTVTGACGFIASFVMLKLGLTSMAARYPLAMTVAYCTYLMLIGAWLRRFRLRARNRSADSGKSVLDIVEVPVDLMWDATPTAKASSVEFGRGGGFSGGGVSGTWTDNTVPAIVASPTPSSASGGSGSTSGGGWALDGDADWLIPVAIIVALVLGVVIYVVYIAPVLFAELLLDASLAAGLYRQLQRVERQSWVFTAVRSTVLPALFVAGLLALAGGIMQSSVPDAASIGAVVHHVLAHSPKPSDER